MHPGEGLATVARVIEDLAVQRRGIAAAEADRAATTRKAGVGLEAFLVHGQAKDRQPAPNRGHVARHELPGGDAVALGAEGVARLDEALVLDGPLFVGGQRRREVEQVGIDRARQRLVPQQADLRDAGRLQHHPGFELAAVHAVIELQRGGTGRQAHLRQFAAQPDVVVHAAFGLERRWRVGTEGAQIAEARIHASGGGAAFQDDVQAVGVSNQLAAAQVLDHPSPTGRVHAHAFEAQLRIHVRPIGFELEILRDQVAVQGETRALVLAVGAVAEGDQQATADQEVGLPHQHQRQADQHGQAAEHGHDGAGRHVLRCFARGHCIPCVKGPAEPSNRHAGLQGVRLRRPAADAMHDRAV